jgi:hypothetical protein
MKTQLTEKELKEMSMTVAEAGRRGGQKTLEKNGKDYFKKLSKKGVMARKVKKLATEADK